MMKDPTAMPMIVPIDSSVGPEGWSRSGDRTAGPGEFLADPGELVSVVESDGMVAEVVFVVPESDFDDAVPVCYIRGNSNV